MQYVRIRAKRRVARSASPPLNLDAVLDKDNRIVGGYALVGVQSELNGVQDAVHYPFTLDQEGRVDFGTGYDGNPTESRYSKWDVRDHSIHVGLETQLTNDLHPNELFVIESITPLPIQT